MAMGGAILHRPRERAQSRAVVRDRDTAGEEQSCRHARRSTIVSVSFEWP